MNHPSDELASRLARAAPAFNDADWGEVLARYRATQAPTRSLAPRPHGRRALSIGLAVVAMALISGIAIAADILPFGFSRSHHAPNAAALMRLRAIFPTSPTTGPATWNGAPKLDFSRALVVAEITSLQPGPLSLIVVPAAPRGICLDAARPDGSSYLAGCATTPTSPRGTCTWTNSQSPTSCADPMWSYSSNTKSVRPVTAAVDGFLIERDKPYPLSITIRAAPPGAATIDVRTRSATKLPAVISNGWILYLNAFPRHGSVLVRIYDKHGKRLLSYSG